MKRILILITLTAAATFTGRAQAPYGDGESLSYTVSYSGVINVMKVNLRTVTEDIGGKPHYHIVGNGKTTNFIKGLFFDLNDTYHSWLDAGTLMPTRMTSDIQEDKYRFKATYNYDWNSMQVNTVTRNAKWDADKYKTMTLKDNSGDALSLLYRLRGIDVEKLEVGKRYPLDLVLDDATKTIYYTYLGREELKVKKAGTFKAIKIKCTMATSDGTTYEDGMELTAWVSDDGNRIPLYIESPIKVGSVRVSISAWKVNHPLTSKIK